jgi:hypothetical protein
MITVRQAAERAAQYAKSLLDEQRAADLRLEEVDFSQNGTKWLITLSMPHVNAFGISTDQRDYKTFYVNRDDGEVVAMKIRELAGAE